MTLCSRPRHEAALKTVGVEHLALHALSPLGFAQKLAELGINGALRAAILGNVIERRPNRPPNCPPDTGCKP